MKVDAILQRTLELLPPIVQYEPWYREQPNAANGGFSSQEHVQRFLESVSFFSMLHRDNVLSVLSDWFRVNLEREPAYIAELRILCFGCFAVHKVIANQIEGQDQSDLQREVAEYMQRSHRAAINVAGLTRSTLHELDQVFIEAEPKIWAKRFNVKTHKTVKNRLNAGKIRGWIVTENRWRIHRDDVPRN